MSLVHGGPAGSCGEGSGCLGLEWDSELRNFLSEGSGNMERGGKMPHFQELCSGGENSHHLRKLQRNMYYYRIRFHYRKKVKRILIEKIEINDDFGEDEAP